MPCSFTCWAMWPLVIQGVDQWVSLLKVSRQIVDQQTNFTQQLFPVSYAGNRELFVWRTLDLLCDLLYEFWFSTTAGWIHKAHSTTSCCLSWKLSLHSFFFLLSYKQFNLRTSFIWQPKSNAFSIWWYFTVMCRISAKFRQQKTSLESHLVQFARNKIPSTLVFDTILECSTKILASN